MNFFENWTDDIIIVGAGVAGSSLAYSLGKLGYKVCLIERELKEPDRIVGELMQPGGLTRLKILGLDKCLDNIDAIDVYGYAIIDPVKDDRQVLSYPNFNVSIHEFFHKSIINQRIIGRSFHYGRFVMNLREAAKSINNVTLIEGTAKKLIYTLNNEVIGIEYTCHSSNENEGKKNDQNNLTNTITMQKFAPLIFLCDGCFSNFRKQLVSEQVNVTGSNFVGIILENCKLPFPNYGHVILADPGPILSYQIGTNEIRVLVDVPSPLPNDLIQYLITQTAPQLPIELRESFIESVKTKRLRSMPNNKLHPSEKSIQPGVVLLGDAWNMRHPLTGGGMTVALSDVTIIVKILSKIKDIKDREKITKLLQKEFYIERKPLASTINILASALYQLFSAKADDTLPFMRTACLEYFKLGGNNVLVPMSLLSGMCTSSRILLYHFFRVALYGAWRTLKPFPTPKKLIFCYRLLGSASWIVIPLMKGEKVFGFFSNFLTFLFYLVSPKQQIPSKK